MTMKEAIKGMLKRCKKTQVSIATELGYKSAQSMINQMYRGDMKVSKLVQIAKACGYNVVLQPNNEVYKLIDGQYVIDEYEQKGDNE